MERLQRVFGDKNVPLKKMVSQLDKLKYITHFVLWKHLAGIEHECFHLISMYNYPEKWDATTLMSSCLGVQF